MVVDGNDAEDADDDDDADAVAVDIEGTKRMPKAPSPLRLRRPASW